MPELPELEALVEALDPLVSRAPVRDVPVAHFAVVKTATPPIAWLGGHPLQGARRRGKHLLFATDDDLVLTIHLMTAGKLAYVEPAAPSSRISVQWVLMSPYPRMVCAVAELVSSVR